LFAIGVEPSDAIFVGDHPVDARAASAAGLQLVATLTGTSAMQDFTGLPVAGFAATLAELARMIGRLCKRREGQRLAGAAGQVPIHVQKRGSAPPEILRCCSRGGRFETGRAEISSHPQRCWYGGRPHAC